ncbi:hypothetical protein E2320_017466, partial [Naja naja]
MNCPIPPLSVPRYLRICSSINVTQNKRLERSRRLVTQVPSGDLEERTECPVAERMDYEAEDAVADDP